MTHGHTRKTALVTGASGGIGYALAKVFAHEGYNLVLVSRNEERLLQRAEEISTTCGVTVTVIAADLSLPTGPVEVYRELRFHGIPVDVLVNNAGFAVHGYFAATDWQEELSMIQCNLVSLTRLTKLFLSEMLARGEGKILNVASTAAFQPGPLMAVYYATKAYVLSFSGALREELRGSGVTVTALCPGPTRTNFPRRAKAHHIRLFQGRLADPATVARAGYDSLVVGKAVVIPGWLHKAGAIAVRIFPRSVVRRFTRYANDHES